MLPCLSRLPFSWLVRSRSSLPFTLSGDGKRPAPNRGWSAPARVPLALLGGAAFLLFLLSPPAPSRADIYRWEDSQGTVHFTDDITNIPSQYRKNSTLLIREAPSVVPPPQAAPPAGVPQASPPPHARPALSAQEQAK